MGVVLVQVGKSDTIPVPTTPTQQNPQCGPYPWTTLYTPVMQGLQCGCGCERCACSKGERCEESLSVYDGSLKKVKYCFHIPKIKKLKFKLLQKWFLWCKYSLDSLNLDRFLSNIEWTWVPYGQIAMPSIGSVVWKLKKSFSKCVKDWWCVKDCQLTVCNYEQDCATVHKPKNQPPPPSWHRLFSVEPLLLVFL